MTGLPRVAAPVLTAAVDALPDRLRRKLDAAVATAAGWPVTVHDGHFTVAVDGATTVTLLATDGAVTGPEQVTCTCLLAPKCLHRAAVLARAPADDGGPADSGSAVPAGEPVEPAAEKPGDVSGDQTEDLTGEQRSAAEHLWQAGAAVLAAGVSGSGVVLRAALLRATHEARVHGLHRAAAAGRNVATHLHAARELQPQYRLGDLSDDLRELLLVTRALREPGPATSELVGTARRRYDVRGSLRLYGLCSVPVVAGSGYGGVVTYLADRDCRVWMVSDLMPGGEERAAVAGEAPVALGEASLTHRALGRGGLVVSGATASDIRALGAGRQVKAVRARGAAWTEDPLAGLWATPLDEQVARAFAALALPVQDRAAGDDLLFVSGRINGADSDGVSMVTADGTVLTLTVPSDHAALAYRGNLRRLAEADGIEVRVVGRPEPLRRLTLCPLALSTSDLELPHEWAGHVDLGFDRVPGGHGHPGSAAVGTPGGPPANGSPADGPAVEPAPLGDFALHRVRRHVERVVAGGRAVQALASPDDARLRAARLDTGAGLVRALTTAAQARPRDPFGRSVEAGATAFADAWLATAVYEQAASWALAEASWHPRRGAG
ncbi:MAG TPA: hypothetical protein VFB84_16235 [Micromonosporaceae bacterium]|nr:hypothetical protein [Micromonosporaceae bacterium]